MPLQERFGARPMWACLVACPVNEITSFVVDSSRSRKSVIILVYIISFPASAIASQTANSRKNYLDDFAESLEAKQLMASDRAGVSSHSLLTLSIGMRSAEGG